MPCPRQLNIITRGDRRSERHKPLLHDRMKVGNDGIGQFAIDVTGDEASNSAK